MTDSIMSEFSAWVASEETSRAANFRGYVYGIAQARYVIRRVFRLVEEQATKMGLESLEHQALLQIYGAGGNALTINGLAERLDIVPAFASRLCKELQAKGMVTRTRSSLDKRITNVMATDVGERTLRQIDQEVHVHIEYFQKQLGDDSRFAALVIFAFYLGIGVRSPLGVAIHSSVLCPAAGLEEQDLEELDEVP